MEHANAYAKGVDFEKFVAELFKRAGYIVEHNVVLTGRSGVKHQVDLLATYKTPIMDFKVLIECKNWRKPVNKDVVMKVYNEVQDLGLNKGVIVTQSYATPDAVAFAKSVGIEIIDAVKLRELIKSLGIEVSVVEVEKEAYYFPVDMSCLQKFINEGLTRYRIYYYPLYMLKLKVMRTVKKGLFRVERYVVEEEYLAFIDAIKGYSIKFISITGQIVFEKQVPTDLSNEELEVYKYALHKYVLETKEVNVDSVAGRFGISSAKARKILEALVSRNLLKTVEEGRRKYYIPTISLILYKPTEILKILQPPAIQFLLENVDVSKILDKILVSKTEIPEGIELRSRLSIAELIKVIEAIINAIFPGSKVEDYKLVYYPITMVVQNGRRKLIDMYVCIQVKHPEKIIDVITW